MHVLRDDLAIRGAVTTFPDLRPHLQRRIEELSEYDCPLHDLVNLYIAEPGDGPDDISREMEIDFKARPTDAMEAHPGCYELTFVLRDDGFGAVLYVPIRDDMNPEVLELCASHLPEGAR